MRLQIMHYDESILSLIVLCNEPHKKKPLLIQMCPLMHVVAFRKTTRAPFGTEPWSVLMRFASWVKMVAKYGIFFPLIFQKHVMSKPQQTAGMIKHGP